MKNSFSQTKIPLLQGKYVDKRVPLTKNILINSYNCIVRRSARHPIENYFGHLFMDDFHLDLFSKVPQQPISRESIRGSSVPSKHFKEFYGSKLFDLFMI